MSIFKLLPVDLWQTILSEFVHNSKESPLTTLSLLSRIDRAVTSRKYRLHYLQMLRGLVMHNVYNRESSYRTANHYRPLGNLLSQDTTLGYIMWTCNRRLGLQVLCIEISDLVVLASQTSMLPQMLETFQHIQELIVTDYRSAQKLNSHQSKEDKNKRPSSTLSRTKDLLAKVSSPPVLTPRAACLRLESFLRQVTMKQLTILRLCLTEPTLDVPAVQSVIESTSDAFPSLNAVSFAGSRQDHVDQLLPIVLQKCGCRLRKLDLSRSCGPDALLQQLATTINPSSLEVLSLYTDPSTANLAPFIAYLQQCRSLRLLELPVDALTYVASFGSTLSHFVSLETVSVLFQDVLPLPVLGSLIVQLPQLKSVYTSHYQYSRNRENNSSLLFIHKEVSSVYISRLGAFLEFISDDNKPTLELALDAQIHGENITLWRQCLLESSMLRQAIVSITAQVRSHEEAVLDTLATSCPNLRQLFFCVCKSYSYMHHADPSAPAAVWHKLAVQCAKLEVLSVFASYSLSKPMLTEDACFTILTSFPKLRVLGMGDEIGSGFIQKSFEMAAKPLDTLVIHDVNDSSFHAVANLVLPSRYSSELTALHIYTPVETGHAIRCTMALCTSIPKHYAGFYIHMKEAQDRLPVHLLAVQSYREAHTDACYY